MYDNAETAQFLQSMTWESKPAEEKEVLPLVRESQCFLIDVTLGFRREILPLLSVMEGRTLHAHLRVKIRDYGFLLTRPRAQHGPCLPSKLPLISQEAQKGQNRT